MEPRVWKVFIFHGEHIPGEKQSTYIPSLCA